MFIDSQLSFRALWARCILLGALVCASPGYLFAQGAAPVDEHDNLLSFEGEDDSGQDYSFDLDVRLWLNYSMQLWQDTNRDKYANLAFNQFQLIPQAAWGNWSAMLEFRVWREFITVRQAWIQYQWEDNTIQFGQFQMPWGRPNFSSNSWWFSLGWYMTTEDKYGYGLKYIKDTDRYRLDLAYSVTDATGFLDENATFHSRLSEFEEQQNREYSTGAIRAIYKFQHGGGNRTELGVSGQLGLLDNSVTQENGWRYMAALSLAGYYKGGWETLAQVTRYEFRPNNPDFVDIDGVQTPVDNRIVRVGQFTNLRDIAAKGNLYNFVVSRLVPVNRGIVRDILWYVNYSYVDKDVSEFPDSHLITPGAQIQMGPFWLWADLVIAKNATFVNDSFENSGLGAGANRPDRFEYRPNLQIQWYF